MRMGTGAADLGVLDRGSEGWFREDSGGRGVKGVRAQPWNKRHWKDKSSVIGRSEDRSFARRTVEEKLPKR